MPSRCRPWPRRSRRRCRGAAGPARARRPAAASPGESQPGAGLGARAISRSRSASARSASLPRSTGRPSPAPISRASALRAEGRVRVAERGPARRAATRRRGRSRRLAACSSAPAGTPAARPVYGPEQRGRHRGAEPGRARRSRASTASGQSARWACLAAVALAPRGRSRGRSGEVEVEQVVERVAPVQLQLADWIPQVSSKICEVRRVVGVVGQRPLAQGGQSRPGRLPARDPGSCRRLVPAGQCTGRVTERSHAARRRLSSSVMSVTLYRTSSLMIRLDTHKSAVHRPRSRIISTAP